MAEPCSQKREGGFTLLEVVVSLALLGLLFAAVFGVFAAGMRSSRTSSEYTLATIEAERIILDVLAKGIGPEVQKGVTEAGYRWRAEAVPDQSNTDEVPARVFHVRVSVAWPSGNREKQLDLVTLALGPKHQLQALDAGASDQSLMDETGVGASHGMGAHKYETR